MEIGISLSSAAASVFGIGKPAVVGATPTSPVSAAPENAGGSNPATLMAGAVAWGTPPTAPATFNRRISLAAAVGSSAVIKFEEGLRLGTDESFVLWNLTENAAADVWFVTAA